jgi:hypothetical protein
MDYSEEVTNLTPKYNKKELPVEIKTYILKFNLKNVN